MAEIKTIVKLDKKEIDDALIALAKSNLDKCVGGTVIEYTIANNSVAYAIVSFQGKVKT